MNARQWYETQERNNFPALTRGAIFLSSYHGNIVSRLITKFQGKGCEWSHTGIYVGNGQVAEATVPHGRIGSLYDYMDGSYTFEIYTTPTWFTKEIKSMVCSEAVRLAPRPYDYWKIAREFIDNLFERLTWNDQKQSGWRPLQMILRDKDKDRKNVCSELVERSIYYGTGERMTSGELGTATPRDVEKWIQNQGVRPVLRHEFGNVVAPRP